MASATSPATRTGRRRGPGSRSATRSRPRSPRWAPSSRCTNADGPAAGQVVDSAIYEAVLAMMESLLPEWQIAGYQRERTVRRCRTSRRATCTRPRTGGGAHRRQPGHGLPPPGRGHGAAGAWRPTSVTRPTARAASTWTELDGTIAEWTSTVKADELLELLHGNGVPAGRIFRAKDMFADPHFAAREAIVKLAHPELGEFAMHNVAPKLSDTPGAGPSRGPELGEHNEDIYQGLLGLDDDAMSSLRSAGVI